MSRPGCLLAEVPDFGRVFDCGECGLIHVKVGPVSVTLTPEAYMQLVALINTSAANFEIWLQQSRRPGADQNEGIHADRDTDQDQF